MNISNEGLELIRKFEGCRLTSYQDSVHPLDGTGSPGWIRTSDPALIKDTLFR